MLEHLIISIFLIIYMKKEKIIIIDKLQNQLPYEPKFKSDFQNEFQGMLSRQHVKQFHLIDSPNIVYNLSMIRPHSVSSISKQNHIQRLLKQKKQNVSNLHSDQSKPGNITKQKLKKNSHSFTKNSFSFFNKTVGDRDKYKTLKEKLSYFIKNIQNQEDFNFSQILQYKQVILKQFLFSIISDLKRQCKQKGQFVEFVWNNMFLLINRILSALTDKKMMIQKYQLEKAIKEHTQYHSLIDDHKKKLDEISSKSSQAQQIISKLVYELRFKKKQVKRLYANLHVCTQKLNQFKNSYNDVQNQHINLLMTMKDVSRQQAQYLFSKRQEINNKARVKIKLNENRKKIQRQIKEELAMQMNPFKNDTNLIQQLKGIIQLDTLDQNSAFMSNILDKFNSSNQNNIDPQLIQIEGKKNKKVSVATQMQDFFKFSTYLQTQSSQTTYSDKIQNQLISTKATQTTVPKTVTKKFQSKEIQADGDVMRIILIKKKLFIYRTVNLDFCFSGKYKQNVKPFLTFHPNMTSSQFYRNPKTTQSLIPQIIQPIIQEKKNSFVQNPSISMKRKKEKASTKVQNQRKKNSSQISKFESKKSNERKNNRRGSQGSFNVEEFIRPQEDLLLLNQDNQNRLSSPKFSIKRHRSSVFAQSQNLNSDAIQFNSQKTTFIENNFINKNKEYFVIQQQSIFKNFKQNLKQKPNDKFNKTLPQTEAKHLFLKKSSMSNFSNFKPANKIQSPIQFKSSFHNFSNFMNENKNSSPLISKTIDKILLKSLIKITSNCDNYKECKQKSSFQSIFDKLNPLILDVLNMINLEPEHMKKRHRNNFNIKNSYKILMLVFSKAFDMINRKIILQTLAMPLFEAFQLMYGALKIQDIYKKMITFIVGIVSTDKNQIFKTFLFFFGLQNIKNVSNLSQKITTADTVLFLKLLQKLSLGAKVGTDIQNAYTTIQKVNDSLHSILLEEQIPQIVIREISRIIQHKFGQFKQFLNQKGIGKYEKHQTKLNLFKMARIIVQQIIKIKQSLIQSFQPLFHCLNDQKKYIQEKDFKNKRLFKETNRLGSQIQQISVGIVQKIVKCCKLRANSSFQILKLLKEISKCHQNSQQNHKKGDQKFNHQKSQRTITKNEFSSLLLKLNILNLDQILKINEIQLKQYKKISKFNAVHLQYQQISLEEKNTHKIDNQIYKQALGKQHMRKIYFLSRLEDESNYQLEHFLKQINALYHLSIFSVQGQKQKTLHYFVL